MAFFPRYRSHLLQFTLQAHRLIIANQGYHRQEVRNLPNVDLDRFQLFVIILEAPILVIL